MLPSEVQAAKSALSVSTPRRVIATLRIPISRMKAQTYMMMLLIVSSSTLRPSYFTGKTRLGEAIRRSCAPMAAITTCTRNTVRPAALEDEQAPITPMRKATTMEKLPQTAKSPVKKPVLLMIEVRLNSVARKVGSIGAPVVSTRQAVTARMAMASQRR